MAADVTGCSLPANTSKKSCLRMWRRLRLGLLWCVAGKAGVRAVRSGPCESRAGIHAHHARRIHACDLAIVLRTLPLPKT